MDSIHYCYVLFNDTGLTYNGYTVNPSRRIRQHNGIIVGGAKYTSRHNGWKFLYTITSEQFTKHSALAFEYMVKYPTRRKPAPKIYRTVQGRLESLALVIAYEKFANLEFTIKVLPQYIDQLKDHLQPYSDRLIIEEFEV